MIAWFIIKSQYTRPAGKASVDFPNPTETPMYNITEVFDPNVPDNEAFAETLSLPRPADYPPGDHTNRLARICIKGYSHGEYSTKFRTEIKAWGGKVDMTAAMAAMVPAKDATLVGMPTTAAPGTAVGASSRPVSK